MDCDAKQAESPEVDEPLSVTAALARAKGSLESVHVRVVGEISELSNKRGYKAVYFSVKDHQSVLPCQIWMNRYDKLGITLAVGQLVEMTGRFTLYAAKGRMNFEVRTIELAGEGKLRMQVANLARKLEAEGLMDPARKLPLPAYPQTIGVVTSPRGKAVHDVLRTLRTRFPVAEVKLAGVTVEGPAAVDQILEGMRCMLRAHVEVILLVRGGGTYEELMPFNDERLARAIAVCPIPVVTGIGHEPDNSIADMVADARASLPARAADMVSPDRQHLVHLFEARAQSLTTCIHRAFERAHAQVERCVTRPIFRDANLLFAAEAQALDVASDRLFRAIPANVERDRIALSHQRERMVRALPNAIERDCMALERQKERLHRALPNAVERDRTLLARQRERLAHVLPQKVERERTHVDRELERLSACGSTLVPRFTQEVSLAAARLNDLSPLNIIGRGYAIARTQDGSVIKRVEAAPVGSHVQVTVSDGVLDCKVEGAEHIKSEIVSLGEDA